MCEACVYFKAKGKEEILLKDIVLLKSQGDKILISDMDGKKREICGIIKEVDFMSHRVIVEGACR